VAAAAWITRTGSRPNSATGTRPTMTPAKIRDTVPCVCAESSKLADIFSTREAATAAERAAGLTSKANVGDVSPEGRGTAMRREQGCGGIAQGETRRGTFLDCTLHTHRQPAGMRSTPAPPAPPTVLFVCGQNAARSQMAAALFKQKIGPDANVISAGIKPAAALNPSAVQVLGEVGIDASGEVPKAISAEAVDASTLVVAVGCAVPDGLFAGKRVVQWDVKDPKDQPIETMRQVRDSIAALVDGLVRDVHHGKSV
jgi:arsenate reductase